MNNSIWYVGGKSAGHIMPLITLSQKNDIPAVFITTHGALDKKIIQEATQTAYHFPLYLPDIQRTKFWLYPWYLVLWGYAGIQLLLLFFKTRPEKVISTGGHTAIPVFLFAKCIRIPCELFELNAVPGYAVKFIAPLSTQLFYCYKTVLKHLKHRALHYKPYPIREFTYVTTYESRMRLKLDPEKKTICFLGGSQGSRFINEYALRIIERFEPREIQVIHQAGPADVAHLSAWYAEHRYTAFVVDYYGEIELLYSAADLVVCRAGAGTLWELEYMNIPTCIVPLETATTDHQLHNAQALCAQKPQQFFMIRQTEAERNLEKIISLLRC